MQAALQTAARRSKAILAPSWSACSTIGNAHVMAPGRPVFSLKSSCFIEKVHAEALAQGQGCPTSSNSSRNFSIQPEDTVYGGPTAPLPKRVTLRTLQNKYRKKQPISMVTAYDYPSAVHVSNHSQSDQTTACAAALSPTWF